MGPFKGLSAYQTVLFDFDGVLANTNSLKTDCFQRITSGWGNKVSSEFVEWHKENGGLSRYEKLAHFLNLLDPQPSVSKDLALKQLVEEFATCVRNSLKTLPETTNILGDWRIAMPSQSWGIVSGFDEEQLKALIDDLPLIQSDFFDLGVHGSPMSKFDIVERLISNNQLRYPIVFFGDGQVDYRCALEMGFDFGFVQGWSEWRPINDELLSFSVILETLDSLATELQL